MGSSKWADLDPLDHIFLTILFYLVYFLVKGAAGYVLPRFDNKAYMIIN